jgi:hypothetical protein
MTRKKAKTGTLASYFVSFVLFVVNALYLYFLRIRPRFRAPVQNFIAAALRHVIRG